MPMTPFAAASIVIVLAAVLGYINHRTLRLPQSIALTVMGAVASLIVVGVDRIAPTSFAPHIVKFIATIDFRATLMDGMLSFLLFAGALHVDWQEMRRGRWAILALSTVSVIASTLLVGFGLYFITKLLSLPLTISWCLVFGALISPTDPVAIMAVLGRSSGPKTLQATVAGESLFNDGVGVVVFTILLAAAEGLGDFTLRSAVRLFFVEAGGGVAIGLLIGWVSYRAMKAIDDYNLEVMITLAVVMGGYTLASWVHVSGPVAMAVAGLFIGNQGIAHAMSDITRDYVIKFWALIDDVLNAVLFLLIGLEVITIPADIRLLGVGLLAIPLALLARAISVLIPIAGLSPIMSLGRSAPVTLIWGGLRGGISVALALGLHPGPERSAIIAATYAVVLFSVIVQGGTIERVLAFYGRTPAPPSPEASR